ncbi:MAG: HNH endonuclease [Anaerolineae bacterium]|nr:HNH endonuclease [Anaerolineae bacterium]
MSNEAKFLFEHFRSNLNLIRAHPRVKMHDRDDVVMCPLCCKKWFTLDAIKERLFTIEHVPPKALQGTGIAMTCKNCNNDQGSHLDSFLTSYINDFDALAGKGENYVDGDVSTDEAGKVRVQFRSTEMGWEILPIPGASHPQHLASLDKQFQEGNIDKIRLTLRTKAPRKPKLALLRAGYLYAFGYMGYGFLLNQHLGVIRFQLQHPKEDIFPLNAIHLLDEQNAPDGMLGVNVITHPKWLKSYYIVFDIKAKNSVSHRIGVMLPGPNPYDAKVFIDLKANDPEKLPMTIQPYDISFEHKLEFPFIAHDIWHEN